MNYSDNEDIKIYIPKIKNPTDINKEENDICDCVKIYPENKNLST